MLIVRLAVKTLATLTVEHVIYVVYDLDFLQDGQWDVFLIMCE
jgi:hypothetical protein